MRLCFALLAILLAVFCSVVQGAGRGPLPPSCSGSPNSVPLVNYDPSTATLVGSVANGTLYTVLPNGATTPLLVLNVFGDNYSMGYAYGQLLTKQISELIPLAYEYFAKQFHVPANVVNELLDLTCNTTAKFTPAWHLEILHGIADGTNGAVSYTDVYRLSMIPELIKATCSITGAWGQATATGGLIQLRALDWGTDGPFQNFPLLATWHPNDGSFTYTNLGWAGLYGTITGWSSSNLAVSEKVWYAYKKLDNIYGYPWTFLLQDIMRFDQDIDAALSRIGVAVRTCAIWLGLGQGKRPNPLNPNAFLPANFKLVSYSFEQLAFYNPENFPYYDKHDYFPDLLFVNKHVQPSGESCMNDLYHWAYGSLVASDFATTITPLEETGNMHIAVMDFDNKQLYVANAHPMPNNSPAFNNGFVLFNATALWTATAPGQQ